MAMEVTKKVSKGRQKIDIVKMKNENNLQVTFSKRRAGLFKKASELCTLTGSEIAVLVFSPGDKVYSFGSPSVMEIIQKFESQTPHLQVNPPSLIMEAHRRVNVLTLNRELGELESQFEEAKKRGESLSQMMNPNPNNYWWEAPIDELSLEQLEELKLSYEELNKYVQVCGQNMLPDPANLLPNYSVGDVNYAVNPAHGSNPLNFTGQSSTSAFLPYDSGAPVLTNPPMPFINYPYVGPVFDENNIISIRNGAQFGIGAYANPESMALDPNSSGFGPGAGSMALDPCSSGFGPGAESMPLDPNSSGFGPGAMIPPYEYFNHNNYGGGAGGSF